jgi:hypothetical protein
MADPVRKIVNAVIRNLEDRSGFDWWWRDVDAKTRTEIRKSLAEDVRKVLVRDERARQRATEDEAVDIGNGDEPPPSAAAIASVLAIADGPARPEVAVEFVDEDEADPGFCAKSQRVDGPLHSWRFDGDDPYIICAFCNEMRDALTGKVLREADRG